MTRSRPASFGRMASHAYARSPLNHESHTLSDTLYPWQSASGDALEGALAADELPLRSELFSAAQMAAHGGHLAARHQLSKKGGPDRLLARLTENGEIIAATCDELTAAVKAGRQITPASEWLLDNFYLIEEQIRTARRHLPKNYSKELPRLSNPDAEGNPARLPDRPRDHRARRRPGRPRKPVALRRRLPGSGAAQTGRTVGDSHHAAPGPDRKPAPRGRARLRQPRPARPRQQLGRPDERHGGKKSVRPDLAGGRHGALAPAHEQRLCRRTGAPPAGPELGAGAWPCNGSPPAWPIPASPSSSRSRPRSSSRRPTRSPSATASAACASWPPWTGANSSRP